MSGFSGRPKILKGAFVEYGISIPPLFVVFQFNPEELTRSRGVQFGGLSGNDREERVETTEQQQTTQNGSTSSTTNTSACSSSSRSLRSLHQRNFPEKDHLMGVQNAQTAEFSEESISFDIRLDATDDMNEGNVIAGTFGILPQLSTLEMMTLPKSESLIANVLSGFEEGFSFTNKEKPPIVLFIWGYTRILPVNLNRISIRETEFNTILNPTRATVGVDLTVIEGNNYNIPYTYSKALKEAMSVLNLANITDVANVVVPG
ncbi:hypothetical protein SAMN05216326_13213 [Nitrosomonas marina]|uniref:Uncharacterized protein n=1 Tax=Nitrosomonas marina TaxID=917 RepID=A0A1I0F166_9PROT|nr:hypothetical protein [Nitrosomonas marina]SET51589.1 hypothetical protein SAMN05216326_13213 [Nitrosomonas marina]